MAGTTLFFSYVGCLIYQSSRCTSPEPSSIPLVSDDNLQSPSQRRFRSILARTYFRLGMQKGELAVIKTRLRTQKIAYSVFLPVLHHNVLGGSKWIHLRTQVRGVGLRTVSVRFFLGRVFIFYRAIVRFPIFMLSLLFSHILLKIIWLDPIFLTLLTRALVPAAGAHPVLVEAVLPIRKEILLETVIAELLVTGFLFRRCFLCVYC